MRRESYLYLILIMGSECVGMSMCTVYVTKNKNKDWFKTKAKVVCGEKKSARVG